MLALSLADTGRLRRVTAAAGRVILAIDGLQPDVAHEVLWVLRDCLSGEVPLARSLLSSTRDDLARLIAEVKEALEVPIAGVVSDGQDSIRRAVKKSLAGAPYQLCHFHYLREAARPVFEADRHAEEELKKKVRGVRPIERAVEGRDDPEAKVVRGHCVAVRSYGRAPRGRRVDGPVPRGHWKVLMLTAAVRLGGVGGCLAFDGATDAVTFEACVEHVTAPTLRPGDIAVMDNPAAHKGPEVERLIRAAGAKLRYLPAYSPDLNPIETMFSKLKSFLRKAAARTVDRLHEAIGDALRMVTHQDIAGWSRSCGYSTTKRQPL